MVRALKTVASKYPKIVFTVVWCGIFICYFCSETVLRAYIVKTTAKKKTDVNILLDKLPAFIRGPIDKYKTLKERRLQIGKAKKAGNEFNLINAYMSLAQVESKGEAKKIYQMLLKTYPRNIMIKAPFRKLLDESRFETIFTFRDTFPDRDDQMAVMATVWPTVKTFSSEKQVAFFKDLLDQEYISGDLWNVYDSLTPYLRKGKMPSKYWDKHDELMKKCLLELKDSPR